MESQMQANEKNLIGTPVRAICVGWLVAGRNRHWPAQAVITAFDYIKSFAGPARLQEKTQYLRGATI
jgi:hypothetical protein